MAELACCALLGGAVLLQPMIKTFMGKLSKIQRQKVKTATNEEGENHVDGNKYKCSTSDAILGELLHYCAEKIVRIPSVRFALRNDLKLIADKILADQNLDEDEIEDMKYILDVLIAEADER